MVNVPWDGAQVMVPISASELYNGVEQKIFVFQRRLGPGMAGKHPQKNRGGCLVGGLEHEFYFP